MNDFSKPDGGPYHVWPASLFLLFKTPQKSLSARLLYSIIGGETKATVYKNVMAYDIDEKTTFLYDDEKKKCKDCLGLVKKVYGREVVEGKVRPENGPDGQPRVMYWCPPKQDIEAAEALLKSAYITPFFIMKVVAAPHASQATLAPHGVAFYCSSVPLAAADQKNKFFPFPMSKQ